MGEQGASASTAAGGDAAMGFLEAQIAYITSHIQIADAKAAALAAYVSVLTGYTAATVQIAGRWPDGIAVWLALAGVATGGISLTAAFMVVLPRAWPGTDARDPFSWVGLSAMAREFPYPKRIEELTEQAMREAMADTIETCALIVRRKYALIRVAVFAGLASTLMSAVSWVMSG